MNVLLIFRGLPASGKTTDAKLWVSADPAKRARVNRDEFRRMLHDSVYLGRDTEQKIVDVEDASIISLLSKGVSVAVDDTNLSQRRARHLARIGRNAGAEVDVWDMTHVALEECLMRDLNRDNKVGEKVIRDMHTRYLKGKDWPLPFPVDAVDVAPSGRYVPVAGSPPAIMVDLDGTMCLHNGRSPYDESRVDEDLPNRPVIQLIDKMANDHSILFCSGRSENCRDASLKWIQRHTGLLLPTLFMRAADDKRKDAVVKRELFDKYIRPAYNVVFVLDDRQRVVDAWREIGLTVFQVAEGAF